MAGVLKLNITAFSKHENLMCKTYDNNKQTNNNKLKHALVCAS